jgi:hypothetical protein
VSAPNYCTLARVATARAEAPCEEPNELLEASTGKQLTQLPHVYQLELNLTVVVGFRSEAGGRGAVLTRSWDRDPPSRQDGDHDI